MPSGLKHESFTDPVKFTKEMLPLFTHCFPFQGRSAFCHAAVGYLEEEAVKTYTHALAEIDAGRLWPDTPVPPVAREYWRLADDATMRDVVLAIRADEACHSHVNHTFSELEPDAPNPFALGAGKEAP